MDPSGQGSPTRRRWRPGLVAWATLALGALAAAFVLTAPASRWQPLELLITLSVVAVLGYFGSTALRSTNTFDATFIAALLAVAFLGPLPAALIWIATEAAPLALRPRPLYVVLANSASFGWATLAAGALLGALLPGFPLDATPGVSECMAIGCAGAAMLSVNFLVGALLIDVPRDRRPLLEAFEVELLGPAPATLAMIALGTAAAYLYAAVGILALALFAAAASIPQILIPLLLRPRPVAALEHSQAVELYAGAIARVMGLSRQQRLVLGDAASFMRRKRLQSHGGELSAPTASHRLGVLEAVLFWREHWDGRGGTPGAVGGELIPLTSRVLAVADAWAGLTAKGSPRLSHFQALIQLEARAEMHFDRRVVQSAIEAAKRQEFGLSGESAYQPRLRRLPDLPGALRALGYRSLARASSTG